MEATKGQIDGFFSQLPYKCHLEAVASVSHLWEIGLIFALNSTPEWECVPLLLETPMQAGLLQRTSGAGARANSRMRLVGGHANTKRAQR